MLRRAGLPPESIGIDLLWLTTCRSVLAEKDRDITIARQPGWRMKAP
jgi:hypothetical protein